jgi:hypothetical protein
MDSLENGIFFVFIKKIRVHIYSEPKSFWTIHRNIACVAAGECVACQRGWGIEARAARQARRGNRVNALHLPNFWL